MKKFSPYLDIFIETNQKALKREKYKFIIHSGMIFEKEVILWLQKAECL